MKFPKTSGLSGIVITIKEENKMRTVHNFFALYNFFQKIHSYFWNPNDMCHTSGAWHSNLDVFQWQFQSRKDGKFQWTHDKLFSKIKWSTKVTMLANYSCHRHITKLAIKNVQFVMCSYLMFGRYQICSLFNLFLPSLYVQPFNLCIYFNLRINKIYNIHRE